MYPWTKYLQRPHTIENLYEETPSLEDFELLEISWDGDEDAAILRGTLSEFADFPEKDWEDDANRVGIRLWLQRPREFSMTGWGFENVVDIDIERVDATTLRLEAVGEDLELEASCQSMQVSNVFGFHGVEEGEGD